MPQQPDAAPTRQRFTFYAAGNRLYARNVDDKVIDLGALARQDDGSWTWRLDGNQLTGGGMLTPEAALREAAARMGFLYLDGQFTAVADAGDAVRSSLGQAVQVELTIDELQPGERMEDARV
jgi:hypothetical protein